MLKDKPHVEKAGNKKDIRYENNTMGNEMCKGWYSNDRQVK